VDLVKLVNLSEYWLDDRRAGELYNRHHHGGLQFGLDRVDNGTEHGLALTPVGASAAGTGNTDVDSRSCNDLSVSTNKVSRLA